ncbi:Kinesin light chain 3, partial [Rhizophlyctis rosea]
MDGAPVLGIQWSFLEIFIAECGGESRLRALTTAQVCETFIKPRTKPAQSFCSHLLTSTQHAPEVGHANWYIIHCWQYNFLDMISAVRQYFARKDPPAANPIIWLDLFSLPQHRTHPITSQYLQTTFTSVIFTIPNTLMVLTTWNNPLPLTRAWCILELYASAKAKTAFDIALLPSQCAAFRDSLQDDATVLYQAVTSIKFEQAETTDVGDLIAIHEYLHTTNDYTTIDDKIHTFLLTWLLTIFNSHLRHATETKNNVDHALWSTSLGKLYTTLGTYEKAMPLYMDALERNRIALGGNHQRTLRSMADLASLYVRQGECDEAESLYLDCLNHQKRVLGEDHPDTLHTSHNLALLYMRQNISDLAEALLIDCLQRRQTTLGTSHRDTLSTIQILGTFYHTTNQPSKAESLFTDSLTGLSSLYGSDHPDTILSAHTLAAFYTENGQYGKAERLYINHLSRTRRTLGEDHPLTTLFIRHLGHLYTTLKKPTEAELLYKDCVERSKLTLGALHPNTLKCTHRLAVFYAEVGEYSVAEGMFVGVWVGRRKVLG